MSYLRATHEAIRSWISIAEEKKKKGKGIHLLAAVALTIIAALGCFYSIVKKFIYNFSFNARQVGQSPLPSSSFELEDKSSKKLLASSHRVFKSTPNPPVDRELEASDIAEPLSSSFVPEDKNLEKLSEALQESSEGGSNALVNRALETSSIRAIMDLLPSNLASSQTTHRALLDQETKIYSLKQRIDDLAGTEITEDIFNALVKSLFDASKVAQAIRLLADKKIEITKDILDALAKSQMYAPEVAQVIALLADKEVEITKDILDVLLNAKTRTNWLKEGIELLTDIEITKDILNALVKSRYYAPQVTQAINFLIDTEITEDILEALVKSQMYAPEVAQVIALLAEKQIEITKDILEALVKSQMYAPEVAQVIALLADKEVEITKDILDVLLNAKTLTNWLKERIELLTDTEITKDILEALLINCRLGFRNEAFIDSEVNVSNIAKAIHFLVEKQVTLTSDIFRALVATGVSISNPALMQEKKNVSTFVGVIDLLVKKNIRLTPNIIQVLLDNPRNVDPIARSILFLSQKKIALTQDVVAALVESKENALIVSMAIESLVGAEPQIVLTQDTLKALVYSGKEARKIVSMIQRLPKQRFPGNFALNSETLNAFALLSRGVYLNAMLPIIERLPEDFVLTPEILNAFVESKQYFLPILKIIRCLGENTVWTPERLSALMGCANNIHHIAETIGRLPQDLLTEQNLNTLIINQGNAYFVAWGIERLGQNVEIAQLILNASYSNGAECSELQRALRFLGMPGVGIEITPPILNALIRSGQQAFQVVEFITQSPEPNSLTPDILNAFAENPVGSCFKVQFSQLANNPKKVLQAWAARPYPPISIKFLDDNDPPQAYPGADAGGLTKQFYSDLLRNLFQEGILFRDFSNGLPTTSNPDDQELKETLALIGKVLSHMYNKKLITGRILPDSFFSILKIVSSNADPDVQRNQLATYVENSQLQSMIRWLQGEESQKNEVLSAIEVLDEEMPSSDEEMREFVNTYIKDALNPYFSIASSFLSGVSSQLLDTLKLLDAEEVSTLIQGKKLDAEQLINLLPQENNNNPYVQQKVDWLKERIYEEFQNGTKWPENFLFCITAQRAITANSCIKISDSHDGQCRARTCFNELLIPTNESTKQEFFNQLDQLVNDASFSAQ